MADDARPQIGVLVGKVMSDGRLVVHPSQPWQEMFTEEDAAPYLQRGWTPIRDPEDLEDAEEWDRQNPLRRTGSTGE